MQYADGLPNEAVAYSLRLAQQNPQDKTATTGGVSGEMKKLADKYAATVAGEGIRYVEVSDALGFQIKTEVWVRGQKFMKRTPDLDEVILCDGTSYIKYDTQEKTGTRFSGGYAAAEGAALTKGMLVKMQMGDPEDKKTSMATYVESLEVGGFGDEAFTVPGDIALTDYK